MQVLDLESNNVRDAEQAIQLGTCSRLWSLTLAANPVCRERWYRRVIVEAVPQLASLDEEDITGVVRQSASVTSKLLLALPPPTLARAVTDKHDNTCVSMCASSLERLVHTRGTKTNLRPAESQNERRSRVARRLKGPQNRTWLQFSRA